MFWFACVSRPLTTSEVLGVPTLSRVPTKLNAGCWIGLPGRESGRRSTCLGTVTVGKSLWALGHVAVATSLQPRRCLGSP
jgi:hypothetical protein